MELVVSLESVISVAAAPDRFQNARE